MRSSERPVRVIIHRNPWPHTVPDHELYNILFDAADNGAYSLDRMAAAGELAPGRDSLAFVLLDPTRPRIAALDELVMATILIGPNAVGYWPNALAKADFHQRHGRPLTEEVVSRLNHLLGDGEFAYGVSADYLDAIAGASGQKPEQDAELAQDILGRAVISIARRRARFIQERRSGGQSHRWFHPDDQPAERYTALRDQLLGELVA